MTATIREAMLDDRGDYYFDPQPINVQRMLVRLTKLQSSREVAVRMRFGPAVLGSYDSDIWYQQKAIKRACRINPDLVDVILDFLREPVEPEYVI